jgi:hypothetical protein
MFKKYGRLIFLVVLLLVATELTIYVNRQVDNKLETEKEGSTVEAIRKQLANSTAKADGMNPYRDYWVYEIGYFAENYPKDEEELFKSVDMDQWNTDFEALKTLVSTEYIDDTTLMNKVSDTIKKYIAINYIQDIFTGDIDSGYFRTIILLMEDDQSKQ